MYLTKKLGEIAKFIDYRGKTPVKTDSGVPLITAKNIRPGYIDENPREYIAESDYLSWMTRGFPNKGDLAFTTEAPLGNIAEIDLDYKIALAQRVIVFQVKENFYVPRFLKYHILSPSFQKTLFEKGTGTTVKGIKASVLREIEIPLPPLSTQSRIVAKLDEAFGNIDKQIELLKGNIEDVENMKKSVLSGAFSSENIIKYNQKMGDFVEFTGGSQPPKNEFIYEEKDGYVRLIQIRDYKSDKHIVYVSKKSVTKFCDKDDIMVGRYGPPIFQILRGIEGAYNVALMKAKFDRSVISGDFLFWFLNNPDIQEYIIALSQRAAGQTGVNKTALESYPIPILPIDKQLEIISYIDKSLEKISTLKSEYETQIQDLEIMKQSLLEEAFAGRLVLDGQ